MSRVIITAEDVRRLFQIIDAYEALVQHLLDQPQSLILSADTPFDLPQYMAAIESYVIQRSLHLAKWNIAHAAKHLKVKRTTLADRIKKLGVTRPDES